LSIARGYLRLELVFRRWGHPEHSHEGRVFKGWRVCLWPEVGDSAMPTWVKAAKRRARALARAIRAMLNIL